VDLFIVASLEWTAKSNLVHRKPKETLLSTGAILRAMLLLSCGGGDAGHKLDQLAPIVDRGAGSAVRVLRGAIDGTMAGASQWCREARVG
jgi:hypothetical protein